MASEAVQILHNENKKKSRATPKNPINVVRSRQAKELVIGLCGAIGSGVLQVKNTLTQELENAGYRVFHIRLSKFISEYFEGECQGVKSLSGAERYEKLQTLGNNMRDSHGSEILAELSIREIASTRSYHAPESDEDNPKFAFLIDQLKNPAEVEIFRLVYPGIFYVLGVLSPEESRRSSLELEGLGVFQDRWHCFCAQAASFSTAHFSGFNVVGSTGSQFLTWRLPQRLGVRCLACSSTR